MTDFQLDMFNLCRLVNDPEIESRMVEHHAFVDAVVRSPPARWLTRDQEDHEITRSIMCGEDLNIIISGCSRYIIEKWLKRNNIQVELIESVPYNGNADYVARKVDQILYWISIHWALGESKAIRVIEDDQNVLASVRAFNQGNETGIKEILKYYLVDENGIREIYRNVITIN